MSVTTHITFSIKIYRGWLVTFAAAAMGLVLALLSRYIGQPVPVSGCPVRNEQGAQGRLVSGTSFAGGFC